MATPDRERAPGRLRLLPRPAPGGGLRAGQPAQALAVAPAPRPGPRAAARGRHGRGLGSARGAVRPRRATGASGGLLPARGRRRRRPVRARRGDPAGQGGAVDRAHPAGRAGPGPAGARGPRSHGGAAQRPLRLLLPGAAGDAGALDRPRGRSRPQGLRAQRHDRALGIAVRPGEPRRWTPDGDPGADPGRARLGAERTGPLRLRWVGRQPRDAGGGAASLRARRDADQGDAVAQRRHPARRARHGLRGARALAARPPRRGAVELSRGDRAGPSRSTTRTAWPWHWPTALSPTSCATTCPS